MRRAGKDVLLLLSIRPALCRIDEQLDACDEIRFIGCQKEHRQPNFPAASHLPIGIMETKLSFIPCGAPSNMAVSIVPGLMTFVRDHHMSDEIDIPGRLVRLPLVRPAVTPLL